MVVCAPEGLKLDLAKSLDAGDEYIVPTWSWASVQGRLRNVNAHDDADADLVEVRKD